ncbi:MAG: pesticin [Phenylobacterium sp.]|uniref:pesticin C-terminus-like muramidase n=1 Tax=Phenylobacterium sp. TaxID=1871053 RepID=UPI0025D818BF|nr:pesticin C-terminus-like muramidase [Phenylobacterium sp.]MBI1199964.1 pesticin [Phenylobacterium sp.]
MRLSDDLDGKDWQRIRRAQLFRPQEAGRVSGLLSDDMDMETWQRTRTAQAGGGAASANLTSGEPGPAVDQFNVDRDFLAEREGARRKMYVPTDKEGRVIGDSGPTIGVGVDLGRKDTAYLRALGLRPELVDQLAPYTGKRRDVALQYVQENPLVLSEQDYKSLNAAVQDRELRKLASKFDAVSQVGPFSKLPRDTQTAIGSLYFQYGTDAPDKAAPNFWRQITAGDWDGAYHNLKKFGDAYQPRRDKEAGRLVYDILSANLPRPKS